MSNRNNLLFNNLAFRLGLVFIALVFVTLLLVSVSQTYKFGGSTLEKSSTSQMLESRYHSPLFNEIDLEVNLEDIKNRFGPSVIRARFVEVDFNELKTNQRLFLNLFDDTEYFAKFDRFDPGLDVDFIWIGHVEGIAHSTVTLVVKDNFLTGNVITPTATYQIRNVDDRVHIISETDQSVFPKD